jgi:Transposase IS116/IS110/IS902 family
VTEYHRFELRLHLKLLDDLEQAIAEVEERLTQALATFRPLVGRLTTIPGISETTARVILGDIGTDMTRFPTAGHLVSWAGLCPRLDESAGQRRSTRVRKGTRWLKTALVQAAWAAVKDNGSYLQAQYVRLKARRGPKKAIVAVAASMLAAIYHIVGTGTPYRDLGATYFDCRHKTHVAQDRGEAKRDHAIALDGRVLEIVQRQLGGRPLHCRHLFHGRGCAPGHTPSKRYACIGDFKKAWRTRWKRRGSRWAAPPATCGATRATAR